MKSEKTLVLFTSTFPYGPGEQFIETEILYLAEIFREVHIYPLQTDNNLRPVPPNVKVHAHRLYQPYNRLKKLFSNFGFVRSVFAFERKHSAHRQLYSKRFRYHLDLLLHRVNDAQWLDAELRKYDPAHTVFYSYWFNYWGTILAFLQHRRKNFSFITRVHGGDYDEQQRKGGYYPFRYYEMQQVKAIYPVSAYGYNYLRRHFPGYKNTLKVFHLGVDDRGDNPRGTNEEFHVVSCSFLIPLKRVHLIVEILSQLNFKVRWTHFGDGPLREELAKKANALPANVRYEFKGHVENAEIIRFYGSEHIDLFMNVSELEGIPVSIMEAISFGIPSTGCAICGVPEIVTEETGFLLEKDFDPADAAKRIAAYNAKRPEDKTAFRQGVKKFWHREFNSAMNYPAFISEIANSSIS